MDYNFDVADDTLFVTRGANMLHVASIRVSSPLAKAINSLRQRIAALEAEKAERERQAPVAWAWNDALGCMHAHCGSRRPVWVDGECSDARRAETSLRPLYAAPPIPRVEQEPVAWVPPAVTDEVGQRVIAVLARLPKSAAHVGCDVIAAVQQVLGPTLGLAPQNIDVDWLSNVIRTVNGNHSLGAGALAEKIAEAINGRAK